MVNTKDLRLHPKPTSGVIPIAKILGPDLIRFDKDTQGQFSQLNYDYKTKALPTITKINHSQLFATFKGQQRRKLTIEELKKFASFPDSYKFTGSYKQQWERIGNCVPPKLMQAVAEHILTVPINKSFTPTVISLFAGCGGSSLGYKLAGYKELAAVEWDDHAVECLRLNFPNLKILHKDVKTVTGNDLLSLPGINRGELFCLDASPPCQSFSTAGKRQLNDPRNDLFREYTRVLGDLYPAFTVMENVRGMIKGHMRPYYLECLKAIRSKGYIAQGMVLNAKYYGVPQNRERVIVVGVRSDLIT